MKRMRVGERFLSIGAVYQRSRTKFLAKSLAEDEEEKAEMHGLEVAMETHPNVVIAKPEKLIKYDEVCQKRAAVAG